MLIVDDDPINRKLLVKLLTKQGITVQEAGNGLEAIALWERWHPHLIWMDMQMPQMDGLQATQQIKTRPEGTFTTIVALTASAFEEQRQKILAAGCDDFVRKPFKKEDIWLCINKHLRVDFLCQENSCKLKPEVSASRHHPSLLTPDQFSPMPATWLHQIHAAAAQGSDVRLLELLDQIPAQYQSLTHALTQLVNDFHFDQIMTLTHRFTLPKDNHSN